MKLVETWCEFGKPASQVLETGRRKGVKGIHDTDDWQCVELVPFEKAFTKREIRGELQFFRENNHLTVAKLVSGEFMEMDSLNMSHAGAYYRVKVLVREDQAKAAELV